VSLLSPLVVIDVERLPECFSISSAESQGEEQAILPLITPQEGISWITSNGTARRMPRSRKGGR
jgi:hypothetical protein